jgi:hypothetical protein
MRGAITELAATRLRAFANAFGLSPLSALRLALLAALDVAALAFAIGVVVGAGDDQAVPKSEWRPPQLLAPPEERAGLAGDELATLSRPIFWRSRRAPPPSPSSRKTDQAAQAGGSATGLTLSGIVKIGEQARAFLVAPGSTEGRWIAQGETIEGWTVDEIADLEVTISDGAQASRLRLYADASEKPAEKAPEQPSTKRSEKAREKSPDE